MSERVTGILGGGSLIAVAALSSWPENWPAFALLGVSAFFLERFSVPLYGEFRYSPAAPIYLAGAIVPSVGPAAMAALLLLEALSRRGLKVLEALEARIPLVFGVLGAACAVQLAPSVVWSPFLLGPAFFLLMHLWVERRVRLNLVGKERLKWLRVRLQMRPLELGAGLAAVGLGGLLMGEDFWTLLFLVPLLASSRQAAENVVLKAKAQTTEQMLAALSSARGQERRAVAQLQQAKTEKQLLEGFAAHLASGPGLEETARSLSATVHQLVTTDDVVIFLKPINSDEEIPEPFFYEAAPAHQSRLQGAPFTQLREPIVDRCWTSKKVCHDSLGEEASDSRLMRDNRSVLALPLANIGVLYLGRQDQKAFTPKELQNLKMLADKAILALGAAYKVHQRNETQERQQRQLQELKRRIALLATLTRWAQEMASTLDLEGLADRLQGLLKADFAHHQGFLTFRWDSERMIQSSWGPSAEPENLALLSAVQDTGRPILIEEFRASPYPPTTGRMESALCVPLMVQEQVRGAILIGAHEIQAFRGEQLDQLMLLAYHAGMAFSNARLYSQVVLARQQLEDSQESLIQSSKLTAIGKLAAGVAHELNTPLGVMALCLEQASECLVDRPEVAERMLGKAQKAIERSRSITERLLAHSRKPSEDEAELDLGHLVEDTISFLNFELRSLGVRVKKQCRPLKIKGRAQELQQVLINLILNAGQAMEKVPLEGRVVEIDLDEDGGEALLRIADSGIGMHPEQKERIFEPFYTTKPVGKGTGLGLWVALQIMEQHKGSITVDSEPGEGATFTLRLPLGG